MGYQDDPVGYEQRLNAKLQPESIRATLGFAGLYQMTHEMLKWAVLDKVREFFCLGIELNGDGSMTAEETEQYRIHVLSLEPKSKFQASLLWLVRNSPITQAQADRLYEVYAHRHLLAHELVRFIVDPDADPDVELLVDALATLKDMHRFWTDVELSTGGFFMPDGTLVGDVDPEEVMSLSLVVLQQCMDAYIDGIAASESSPGS